MIRQFADERDQVELASVQNHGRPGLDPGEVDDLLGLVGRPQSGGVDRRQVREQAIRSEGGFTLGEAVKKLGPRPNHAQRPPEIVGDLGQRLVAQPDGGLGLVPRLPLRASASRARSNAWAHFSTRAMAKS